jgi:hypothetical protein
MRRAVVTLLSVVFLTQYPLAQHSRAPDGIIVERTACPAYTPTTDEDYVAAAKKAHAAELEAAKAEGLTMRTAVGLATREAFDRAQLHSVSGL